ncbi:hypothetical protein HDU98_008583 [Podochytrium sp. JEL0797]|nr:hypothetical protein HDU98_008583 [Podochytrium sp. JEL0797]
MTGDIPTFPSGFILVPHDDSRNDNNDFSNSSSGHHIYSYTRSFSYSIHIDNHCATQSISNWNDIAISYNNAGTFHNYISAFHNVVDFIHNSVGVFQNGVCAVHNDIRAGKFHNGVCAVHNDIRAGKFHNNTSDFYSRDRHAHSSTQSVSNRSGIVISNGYIVGIKCHNDVRNVSVNCINIGICV